MFIVILRQNDASYEKNHVMFSSYNDPKNLKKLVAILKKWNFHNLFINCYRQIGCCWIFTFNFLPPFIDIIFYRLKQDSRCGYEMTKNVQKPVAYKFNGKIQYNTEWTQYRTFRSFFASLYEKLILMIFLPMTF